MAATWTVEDSSGRLLPDFACGSPLEVGLKVVPSRFDAFRLQVSSSYRELFDRALRQVLEREGWHIVQVKASRQRVRQQA
jgi:hypothetical protein